MNFDLELANHMAYEYNYTHYIFLQPSLISANNQYQILKNSNVQFTPIDQLDKMIAEETPAMNLSWLQELFANNPYSHLKLIDWSNIFDQSDDLMFYDWVHLSRLGCAKVSGAICEFVN